MALRYQRMRMLAYISLFPRLVSARSRFILILQKRFIPTIILLMVVVLYHKPWPRYDTSLCKPRADQYSCLPCVAARTLRAGGGTRNTLLQRRSRSAISRHSFSAGLDVASGINASIIARRPRVSISPPKSEPTRPEALVIATPCNLEFSRPGMCVRSSLGKTFALHI